MESLGDDSIKRIVIGRGGLDERVREHVVRLVVEDGRRDGNVDESNVEVVRVGAGVGRVGFYDDRAEVVGVRVRVRVQEE